MLVQYPSKMKAAFLHYVTSHLESVIVPPHRYINGVPIVYFRTYVGASLEAYNLKLISIEGLQRVVTSAERDLQTFVASHQEQNYSRLKWRFRKIDSTSAFYKEELKRDIHEAEKVLQSAVVAAQFQ
jgi:hypothetical protein